MADVTPRGDGRIIGARSAGGPIPRFSAHLGYMFAELPLERRFAAAAESGFAFVEHPAPYTLPASHVATLLDDAGLRFVQLAAPLGDAATGEKGIAALPGREAEFRATLLRAFDYAERIGCRYVHVQSGIAPPNADRSALWETYVAALAFAADAAAPRGLTIIIEAIGAATVSGYYLDDPRVAVRAAAAAGKANLALLFDVFHAVNGGIDPVAFIHAHCGLLAHVHIADHPGRHEPGMGRIDFDRVYAALADAGYAGLIGCEYIPAGDTRAGLGWYQAYRIENPPCCLR